MTVTITDHHGRSLAGQVRCWMDQRVVEIETPNGARHVGWLRPERTTQPAKDPQPSTVDGA